MHYFFPWSSVCRCRHFRLVFLGEFILGISKVFNELFDVDLVFSFCLIILSAFASLSKSGILGSLISEKESRDDWCGSSSFFFFIWYATSLKHKNTRIRKKRIMPIFTQNQLNDINVEIDWRLALYAPMFKRCRL